MSADKILKSMKDAPKLDCSSYKRWSTHFRDVLSLFDIESFIDEEKDELLSRKLSKVPENDVAVQKQDTNIRVALSQLVPDTVFHLVGRNYTARECWKNLQDFYCPDPIGDLDDLIQKFWSFTVEDDIDVDEFVQQLSSIRGEIDAIDSSAKPTDTNMKKRLLAHFIECCDGFYMSISIPLRDSSVTFQTAVTTLRSSQMVYRNLRPASYAALAKNNSGSSPIVSSPPKKPGGKTCAYCQKLGHLREGCFLWLDTPDGSSWAAKHPEKAAKTRKLQQRFRRWKGKGRESNSGKKNPDQQKGDNQNGSAWIIQDYALASGHVKNDDDVVLDTGATNHIFHDESLFTTLSPSNNSVQTASGVCIPVTGIGSVNFRIFNYNNEFESKVIQVDNVWLVPSCSKNLVSGTQLLSKGFKIISTNSGLGVYSTAGELIATAKPKGGLLCFNTTPSLRAVEIPSTLISKGVQQKSTKLLHNRFAHIGSHFLKNIPVKNLGLPLEKSKNGSGPHINESLLKSCHICNSCKQEDTFWDWKSSNTEIFENLDAEENEDKHQTNSDDSSSSDSDVEQALSPTIEGPISQSDLPSDLDQINVSNETSRQVSDTVTSMTPDTPLLRRSNRERRPAIPRSAWQPTPRALYANNEVPIPQTECWKNLQDFYCPDPIGDLDDLIQKFWSFTVEDDIDVDEFVQQLSSIRGEIDAIDSSAKPTDTNMKKRLLAHFIECCDGFYMSISIPLRDSSVTFQTAVTTLRSSQMVYRNLRPASYAALAKNNSGSSPIVSSPPKKPGGKTCAYCQKLGHLREGCFLWLDTPDGSSWAAKHPEKAAKTRKLQQRFRRWKGKGRESNSGKKNPDQQKGDNQNGSAWIIQDYALASGHVKNDDDVVLDTGATNHIFHDESLFTTLSPSNNSVQTASGVCIPVTGIGSVNFRIFNYNNEFESKVIQVDNVWLVPSCSKNLVSGTQLLSKGFKIISTNSGLGVYSTAGELIATAKPKGGLLCFNTTPSLRAVEIPSTLISKGVQQKSTKLLHNRFAHIGSHFLKNIPVKNLGLPLEKSKNGSGPHINESLLKSCHICNSCKQEDTFWDWKSSNTEIFENLDAEENEDKHQTNSDDSSSSDSDVEQALSPTIEGPISQSDLPSDLDQINVSNETSRQVSDTVTSMTPDTPLLRRSNRERRPAIPRSAWQPTPRALYANNEVPIPQTYKEAINGPNEKDWKSAIQEELNSLKEKNVFTQITHVPHGRKPVGSR
ncbi:hypothetical protein FRX31_017498, partial [Thalictrum thalictroides]